MNGKQCVLETTSCAAPECMPHSPKAPGGHSFSPLQSQPLFLSPRTPTLRLSCTSTSSRLQPATPPGAPRPTQSSALPLSPSACPLRPSTGKVRAFPRLSRRHMPATAAPPLQAEENGSGAELHLRPCPLSALWALESIRHLHAVHPPLRFLRSRSLKSRE